MSNKTYIANAINLNLKKGDLIAVRDDNETYMGRKTPTKGYRRMTSGEYAQWEEDHRGTMRCDGESHITDGFTSDAITGLLRVTRARVAPNFNWHKQTGMCEATHVETGVTYFIYRKDIAGVQAK